MGSNVNRFTKEEDELLKFYDSHNVTVAETAEIMGRPFGSVATRRRRLGLAERRGPHIKTEYVEAEYKEAEYVETPEVEAEVFELIAMRKYVVLFYGACLFAAGLIAIFGEV